MLVNCCYQRLHKTALVTLSLASMITCQLYGINCRAGSQPKLFFFFRNVVAGLPQFIPPCMPATLNLGENLVPLYQCTMCSKCVLYLLFPSSAVIDFYIFYSLPCNQLSLVFSIKKETTTKQQNKVLFYMRSIIVGKSVWNRTDRKEQNIAQNRY